MSELTSTPAGTSEPEDPATPEGGDPVGPEPRAPVGAVRWAGTGLAAGVAAVGAAQLVAAVVGASSAPLVAVGDAVVDLTPPWLKTWAIDTFGTWDKTVLLGGGALVLALLCAGCGLLARRGQGLGRAGVYVLCAVAALAAATRPDASVLAVAPSVVGGLLGAWVLGVLTVRQVAASGAGASDGDRRAFRRALLVAVGGGAVSGVAGWVLGRDARGAEASRADVALPVPASTRPLPAGVEVGVPGVVPFRVPTADFYRIDTALVVPRVSAQDWRLRIHGMVEREVTLDFATLVRGALVERDVTLCCVSNEVGGDLVGNARWLGLPIGPLLQQAGPRADADMVLSTSVDGWTASTPLAVLTDGRDALLAVAMNGEPLTIEHGFPVRMVVPGLYGYVSATKWVVDLEVTRFDRAQAYWTPRGWSERGPVKTQSRIDVPQQGATVSAGRVAVAGVAWAQQRGISGVEVSVDDGPWRPATLGAEASVDTWRQWVFAWDATAGTHELRVRATDRTGETQTGKISSPAPDGATGWHTVTVSVR